MTVTHIHGAVSRASVASSEGTKPREGAAARRASSETRPHWTETYLGLAYRLGAQGPDAFDCWSFFRHVQKQRFGRDVPFLATPEKPTSAARACRDLPAALGWRKVTTPVTGDAVLMGHLLHPTHVGVFVDDVRGGAVLHCSEGAGTSLPSVFSLKLGRWSISAFYRPIGEC